MLRCSEVVQLVASEEYAELGWRRRLLVKLHLAMCQHCRRYVRHIRLLGRIAREVWALGKPEEEEAVRRIQRTVARHLGSTDPPGGP
ncbi:MAG: hypothetical protein AB1505_21390 [Candidatus Latescibacterota bacterium]